MQSNERFFEFANIFMKKIFWLILVAFSPYWTGCQIDKKKVDVSGIPVDITIQRFEKDLFSEKIIHDSISGFNYLEKKYPGFFPLFVEKIMRMGIVADTPPKYTGELISFLNNKSIKGLYDMCQSRFALMDDIEDDLENAYKHLKYYYPQTPVPQVFTFISEFGYGVITSDSIVGIGLDMFLGENYVYYPSIGFPEFVIRKLKKEYIVPNVVKAVAKDMFEKNLQNNFLSQIIYNGKIIYFLENILPDYPDSLLIGYTEKQLKWCKENEGEIWNFFLENKLLYSTDAVEYHKFIADGPTSAGMPRESPGNIGSWVGLHIVKKYMDENSAASLQQLMREQDAQKILQLSKYKPKRSIF